MRRKYFKTRDEAKRYLKSYKPTSVMDPRSEEMQVFKYGKRYFLGTGVEFDFVRFS